MKTGSSLKTLKAVSADIGITQNVRPWVPDWRTSHREGPSKKNILSQ